MTVAMYIEHPPFFPEPSILTPKQVFLRWKLDVNPQQGQGIVILRKSVSNMPWCLLTLAFKDCAQHLVQEQDRGQGALSSRYMVQLV